MSDDDAKPPMKAKRGGSFMRKLKEWQPCLTGRQDGEARYGNGVAVRAFGPIAQSVSVLEYSLCMSSTPY